MRHQRFACAHLSQQPHPGLDQLLRRYYKSALYPTLRHIDRILARWAHRKFKSLRRHRRQTAHWIARVARRQPWRGWALSSARSGRSSRLGPRPAYRLRVLGSRWPVPPSARPRSGAVFSAHSLILSTSSWVSRSSVRSHSLVARGLSWPGTCGSRSALAPLRKIDGVN